MVMDKKQLAFVVSVMVFLGFMCAIFYFSDGVNYYWVDESEGPIMVKHERPYLQKVSCWGMLLAANVVVGVAAYWVCVPVGGWPK